VEIEKGRNSVELGIETSARGATVVVAVTGDVDIHTAPHLQDCLDALVAERRPAVVVDLAGVNFLDSSALGVLIAAQRQLGEAGGELRLAAPRAHVRKIFQITRLTEVIPLFDDVDAACG
jgi:anti-sigma B factor antagonist